MTDRDGDLADAYARLLASPDPGVREKAARDWCAWEAAHVAIRPGQRPAARYEDPRFRLAFARIVTHYWRHNCWMDGVDLIGGASKSRTSRRYSSMDALISPGHRMSLGGQ